MNNKRNNSAHHNRNGNVGSSCRKIGKTNKSLTEEFNYNCKTFWNTIPKAHVIIKNRCPIVTAVKDLIAGLFSMDDWNEILALALDLSFYAKCSSTELGFLYQNSAEFFALLPPPNSDNEIVVYHTPKNRNWYEKWIQTSPTTPLEREFQIYLDEPKNDAGVCFLGPWLGTVLLRLERCRPCNVTSKLVKLFKHVNVMHEIGGFHWNDKFFKELGLLIARFPKANVRLPNLKKFALYKAMIETSFRNTDQRARALLNFTTLQSLEFGGMILATLIRDLRADRRALELNDIREATLNRDTIQSWKNYANFVTFFNDMSEEEKYFSKYAHNFDFRAFDKLTYNENMKLCNYLAVLIDSGRTGNECFSVSNPGQTYKMLISNRPNIHPLTDEEFRFCAIASVTLSIKEVTPLHPRAASAVVRNHLLCAEQYQKLADEAFSIAQYQETRAKLYRKAADDYIKKFQISENENE